MISAEAKIPLLGEELRVPVWGGGERHYVNLDNAATTPVFADVWEALQKVMPVYGSIHRGAGYKSLLSTKLYQEAIDKIMKFTDSNVNDDVLIFNYNTTACINQLERRLKLDQNSTIIVGENEHSSNLLPWRKNAKNLTCRSLPEGVIDYNHLEELLRSNLVRLVAVSAASNVTGALTDIHLVARLAHQYGAEIFVDASQLVAHRPIIRKSKNDPEHIDFLAFSGHKMYAPFGLGVLVANKSCFKEGWPDVAGGGTISMIDGNDVIWSDLPARESGGTPNYPGVISLAVAATQIKQFGYEQIKAHEHELTTMFRNTVASIEGITVYRQLENMNHDHLAIFPFSAKDYHHALVGAFLGTEKAIGVRTGHLCQFSLVSKFTAVTQISKEVLKSELNRGLKHNMFGVVRASCGLGNTAADIVLLSEALTELIAKGPRATYLQNTDGDYLAVGWEPDTTSFHF